MPLIATLFVFICILGAILWGGIKDTKINNFINHPTMQKDPVKPKDSIKYEEPIKHEDPVDQLLYKAANDGSVIAAYFTFDTSHKSKLIGHRLKTLFFR